MRRIRKQSGGLFSRRTRKHGGPQRPSPRFARTGGETVARLAELAAWVEAGPDPGRDGVVRWRRSDLARRIASAFGVEVHERTVGTYLATLGYRRLQVAPAAPQDRSAGTRVC